ncbi:hypothetical protein GN956_G19536 [Arapaima gigas]
MRPRGRAARPRGLRCVHGTGFVHAFVCVCAREPACGVASLHSSPHSRWMCAASRSERIHPRRDILTNADSSITAARLLNKCGC